MFKATLILILLISCSANAGGIKKWVDEKGNVHFGTTAPISKQADALTIPKQSVQGGRFITRKQINRVTQIRQREQTQRTRQQLVAKIKPKYPSQSALNKAYRAGRVIPGMPRKMVERMMGKPDHSNTTTTKQGMREQAVYSRHTKLRRHERMQRKNKPNYIYYDKNGRVTTTQTDYVRR